MSDLRVEVKVCEGCGALWVRASGADAIYCRNCVAKLGEMPSPQGLRAAQRRTQVRCADVDQRRTFRMIEGGAR